MPAGIGYGSGRRRKMYRRGRRRSGMNRVSTNKIRGTAMPDSMLVKLKYTDIKQIPSNATFTFSYLGNSMLSPNSIPPTSGNALATGEWTNFYTQWLVYGSSCRVRIVNKSDTLGIFCALYPQDTDVAASDYFSAKSQAYSKNMLVAPLGGSDAVGTVKQYISYKKLKGAWVNDRTYSGGGIVSPPDLWFWHGFCASTNFVTPVQFTLQVDLVYYVKFFNRNRLTQSLITGQTRLLNAREVEFSSKLMAQLEEQKQKQLILTAKEEEVIDDSSAPLDAISLLEQQRQTKRAQQVKQTILMDSRNIHLWKDHNPFDDRVKSSRSAMDVD